MSVAYLFFFFFPFFFFSFPVNQTCLAAVIYFSSDPPCRLKHQQHGFDGPTHGLQHPGLPARHLCSPSLPRGAAAHPHPALWSHPRTALRSPRPALCSPPVPPTLQPGNRAGQQRLQAPCPVEYDGACKPPVQ